MNLSTDIIGPVQGDTNGADLVPPSLDRAREFARHSKAEHTLRGYRADWRDFCAWCDRTGQRPLPASPETVAAYIAECAGRLKVGSIQRRLNAIAEAHKAIGVDSPTAAGMVRNTLKGIKRTLGTAAAQKAPALTDDIRAMVDSTDLGLIGLRDRALILLGFAGAFRRSELVGLDVEDCAFGRDGLTITLRRSKTDQDRRGIGHCHHAGRIYRRRMARVGRSAFLPSRTSWRREQSLWCWRRFMSRTSFPAHTASGPAARLTRHYSPYVLPS